MKRDITKLYGDEFDVCVIGGGIYGACAAWDAALRGLSVALVEKDDFCGATSFNSQNTIHGGFRYLQNMDIPRVRRAVRERRTWMTIAPHFVHPMPFLIPTYRKLSKPKGLFDIAFRIYDALSFDRNWIKDPQKHIPAGKIVSPKHCLELFPKIDQQGLTGGALFYDALIHNPGRLGLSFLKSAVGAGAVIANYAQAIELIKHKNMITGVKIQDRLSENVFVLKSKTVVNMTGPWVKQTIEGLEKFPEKPLPMVKVMYFTVKDQKAHSAVGLLGKNGKYYFMLPWHDHSLIGIAELPQDVGDLEEIGIYEKDVEFLIKEINQSRPGIELKRENIVAIRKGLLPARGRKILHSESMLAKKALVIDHSKNDLNNLISVVGIKFTMARYVAQEIIDMVFSKLGYKIKRCRTTSKRIFGGNIDQFDAFLAQATDKHRRELSAESVRHLVLNYGSAYQEVLKYLQPISESETHSGDYSRLVRAESLYAINEEMAQNLSDVVFRRTELGLLGNPGNDLLDVCAETVAREMDWNGDRKFMEIENVKQLFSTQTKIN